MFSYQGRRDQNKEREQGFFGRFSKCFSSSHLGVCKSHYIFGAMELDGELPGQQDEFCSVTIPLHSPGIWGLEAKEGFMDFALPRLLFQISLIFLTTQSLHLLLKQINIPRIVSEIMAGLVLGKTVMGNLFPDFTETVFPEEGEVFLDSLSKIGFILFMFLVGVKISATMVLKTGLKSWSIGICSSLIPAVVYLMICTRLDITLPIYRKPATKGITGIMTLVPFPVVAALLIDLKIMNSELGRLALASSLISDFIGECFQLFQSNWRLAVEGWLQSLWMNSMLLTTGLCTAVVLSARPLSLRIIKQTPEGKPVKSAYVAFIACMVLATSILSDNVGVQYHFGPFILGLSIPSGPPLGSTLVERLDTLVSGLLAPLLMSFCALKVNLFIVYDIVYMMLIWSIILIMFLAKILSVFVPALLCKMSFRDAAAFSFIMSAQGIVQLAAYDIYFKNETIDDVGFATVILATLLLATITSFLVRLSYDYSRTYTGYQKRNIMHTAYNAELRILACSQRQDDAVAAIKLLEVSNPCKESPIVAYALNLVELVGRATPLLINHKLGQKVSSGGSRSQQMIDIFDKFENQYHGLVQVQTFTAISLPKFMHHDICSLAFDKLASLIILPFHRKWNQNGKLIFDNNKLRTVNRHVLDMAPCSVGILVDRRKFRSQPSRNTLYHVGVIFIGGDDDREALAYGKRMANSSYVHLTVMRITAKDDIEENQWDRILDMESLKDVKLQSARSHNIVYREEKSKDGPDTALIINAMESAFDLLMVGRRHREDSPLLSGLNEWTDLPELGSVGDILASSDVKKPVSVLVVQQQIIKNRKG